MSSRFRRTSIWDSPGRCLLVALGMFAGGGLIVLPLSAIFFAAFSQGGGAYWSYLTEPTTLSSIRLSLLAAAIAVPVNTVFGLVAAWAVSKYRFFGRKLLISLIELPLSVSPLIFGVAFLFVFGLQGLLGPWLLEHDVRLVFNVGAIVLVTTMVTTPFVFRELLPLMQHLGTEQEQAAVILGASGWQVFWRITLPSLKWALVYGVTLAFARSLGEFGSVAVVSGSVRGQTNTMTLQIEMLFFDKIQTAAFAVASILTAVSACTLLLKAWLERRQNRLTS